MAHAHRGVRTTRAMAVLLIVITYLPLATGSATATPNLTITPITWNVIGLDSNNVNTGPNEFLSGARVCNTGTSAASNVVATYVWDSANANINLGGPSTYTWSSLAAGACVDGYFNVAVTRTTAAWNTARRFHIEATATGLGTVSTPTPRELYVEKLVSQNRNSVQSVTSNATATANGWQVIVGNTYTFTVTSKTATQGYEQLSSFLAWPGAIFQVTNVAVTYTAGPPTNDKIYADACGWNNDPTSPSYRSCSGTGKAGGTIVTTYTIRVLAVGTRTVSELIYDFSGSSYHYNTGYGVGVGSFEVQAVSNADLAVTKTDSTDPVVAGNNLTYTMMVTNNGPAASSDTVLSDPVPAGTSFVSASGGGTLSGGTVTWNLGAVSPGSSTSVTMTVRVDPGRTAPISNTATVSASTVDPVPGNDSATEATSVGTSADLSITKTDSPDPVGAGQPLTYTLTVSNAGPSNAQNVSVTDALPAGLAYGSATPSQGSCSEAGGTVTCSLGTIAASGSATITLVVTPGASLVPSVSNTASVSSTTSDPAPGNNSASQSTTVQPRADLSVAKTDSTDPVVAGEDLTYTITVTNDGPSTATGVTVTDPLPAGTSFVSATAGGTEAGGTVTWDLGSLASGASTSVQLVVAVDPGRTADLSNTATVSASTVDPVPGNDSATEATSVSTSADLRLAKTDAADPAIPGQDLTYTITVTNDGPSDATGVVVTDPVPAGTSFVSATGGGTEAAGVVTWNVGALASGASVSFDLIVAVNPGRTADLSNTASVSGDQADPDPSNDDATETTGLTPLADLVVAKTDGVGSVLRGSSTTYTITVTNGGPSSAPAGVVITDPVPAGTTMNESEADCAISAGVLVCTTSAPLAPGDSVSWDATVDVPSGYLPASVTNTAAVNSSPVTDPDGSNDSASDTDTVSSETDLRIAKTDAADPVVAGEDLSYTITVTNDGPSDATGVVVTDPVPAGTSFVSATGGGTDAGGVVTWNVGALASGASVSFDLTVAVDPGRTADLSNTASVSGNEVDPDPSNDEATEPTTVTAEADLSVTKSDSPDPVAIGQTLTYTLVVANDGSSDARDVQVTDTLPGSVTFVSATPTQGSCGEAAGAVTCDLGTLSPGDTASITIEVLPTADGIISNSASVSSTTPDPDGSNDTDVETTTVAPNADLRVAKSDLADPAIPGTDLTYTITVTNDGPSDATGVVVTDPVPAGTSIVSATGGGTEAGGVVTWNVGALANGASASFDVTVAVDPGRTADLSNTASVSGDQPDDDPSDDQATEDTSVTAEADLSITKDDGTAAIEAGTSTIYTITLTNGGPSTAPAGVVVTDAQPAGTVATESEADCTLAAGVVTCTTSAPLAPGDAVTWQVTLAVSPSYVPPTLVNTAAIAGSPVPDANAANDLASDLDSVDRVADLSIQKRDLADPVTAGEALTYELTVTNDGPADATGVAITDPVPAGTSFVSATGGGFEARGVVTWNVGSLAAGDSVTRRVTVLVDPDRTSALSNTGTVAGTETDPVPANDSATEDTDVEQAADLRLSKTDSVAAVEAGGSTTYTITLTNAGPSTTPAGVTVVDQIPAGTLASESEADCSIVRRAIACVTASPLAPGASVAWTLTLVVPATYAKTNLRNVVTIDSAPLPDPVPENDTARDTDDVRVGADLHVHKTSDAATVDPRRPITWTVTVENLGPSDATGVAVRDALPSRLELTSWSASAGSFDPATGRWDVGDLALGEAAELELVTRVRPGTTDSVTNRAWVLASDQLDPVQENDTAVHALASSSAEGDDAGGIAFTGADVLLPLIVAIALAAGGAIALLAGYARRRPEEDRDAG